MGGKFVAVTKLAAVTIAGKIEEFERIVNEYIYKCDIHLENVMTVLGDKEKLHAFDDGVQYESVVKNAENIIKLAGIDVTDTPTVECGMTLAQMNLFLEALNIRVESVNNEKNSINEEIEELQKTIDNIKNIKNVNCDISLLNSFRLINYRFGHIPREGYKLLNTYLSDLDIVFVKTHEDEKSVWGFYFVPESQKGRVDEIFTSLYFERIEIPENVKGNPEEIVEELTGKINNLKAELDNIAEKTRDTIKDMKNELINVYQTAMKRQEFTNVRQKAAHSKEFFYILGWMSEKDAKQLEKEMSRDDGVILYYTEKPENLKDIIKPPTRLKNNIVFRPFEMFVKMYGHPGYDEIDPTPLLAFTYILFFGMMFGDVGQSAVIALAGFLIYKKTKWQLANIIGIVGLSGIIFGFLYGSIFGNEEIIHGVLSPMHNITTLLIGTMAMGAVVIVIGMILNIINSYKKKHFGHMLFSQNGIAGLIFYVSLLSFALSVLGIIKAPGGLLIALIVVSVLLIYLCEPLSLLMEGKKVPKGAMFYVQLFFELFEVMLSYFSNTISFLRIGAFAIVHVGMMMAVAVLSQGSTAQFIIVSVLGNILVMVLEGLVVGIQVLRLEYYEMFSRYFTGNGKPFISLKKK